MIPAYQHIVRSHIGSERANAEPIHLLPPPAAPGLEARSTHSICLSHPTPSPETVITIDPLSKTLCRSAPPVFSPPAEGGGDGDLKSPQLEQNG